MEHVLKLLHYINSDASGHGALVFGLVRTGVDKENLYKSVPFFWKRNEAAMSVINLAQ